MRAEKRKGRLDKVDSGDFVGFASYASPSSAVSKLRWSPVYTGSDSQLALVMTKIGQKRDGATKVKALQDLQKYLDDDLISKKDKVDALAYLVFLFYSKLAYDSSASVRAEILTCFRMACQRVPKAWTTLTSQQTEILGIILCAQADPAVEVRSIAECFVREQLLLLSNKEDLTRGIWSYTLRILSYGRPKTMHDALFAKKGESGDVLEFENDQLDELFERIVGTALNGLEFWIRTHTELTELGNDQACTLWKTLTSPFVSLRQRTYILLGTCCQKLPSIVYGNSSSFSQKRLPQLFTAEKDAANFPFLFELSLSYLVGAKKHESHIEVLDILVKHMSKVLKRACYGATARRWGPTLLPLLSLIQSEEYRLMLLTSTWHGHDQLAGAGEKLVILATVSECAAFLLLQSTDVPRDDQTSDYSAELAKLWLNALSAYLLCDETSSAFQFQSEETMLVTSVARDIQKFDAACFKENKTLHAVSDWFWTIGVRDTFVAAANETGALPLTRLLNAVAQQQNNTEDFAYQHWKSVLLSLFSQVVAQHEESSTDVPTFEKYALTGAILRCCNVCGCSPFDDEETVGRFVMNDLLRWLVMHTSNISLQRNERCAEQNFYILRVCLLPLSFVEQKSLLESFFRELITEECNTQLLAMGIKILLNDISAELLFCRPLDDFLIRIGQALNEDNDALPGNEPVNPHEQEKNYPEVASLLETVASVKVGERVLRAWIDTACPQRSIKDTSLKDCPGRNLLLETLVSLARSGDLKEVDAVRILLECWRRGQELWSSQCFRLLLEDEPLCRAVVTHASMELRACLDEFCASASHWVGCRDAFSLTFIWSERSVRLLDLCADIGSTHRNIQVPSLKVVGLGDTDLWMMASDQDNPTSLHLLFLCLMETLVAFEDTRERYDIVRNANNSSNQMVTNLLLALSIPQNGMQPELRHCNYCSQFLSALGGSAIGIQTLENLFVETVNMLAVMLRSEGIAVNHIAGGVAVLSQVVDLMLQALHPPSSEGSSDQVDRACVQAGDEVWYLLSTDNNTAWERATVSQVHSDDFPNEYYTISWNSGNTKVERQTVAGRLRQSDALRDGVPLAEEIQKLQDRVRDRVFQDLVKPFLQVDSPIEYVAELINVLNSQTGLNKKVGLGSVHFELLIMLRAMEQKLVQLLAAPADNQDQLISLLNSLSFAMGFGYATPSFLRSFEFLRLNPEASIHEILRCYNGMVKMKNTQLDRAVLRWLAVTVSSNFITECHRSVIGLIFFISGQIIGMEKVTSEFSDDCHLVLNASLRAVQSVVSTADRGSLRLTQNEFQCIRTLFSKFALGWTEKNDVCFSRNGLKRNETVPRWHPFLSSLLSLLVERKNELKIVSKGCCNDLIGALFDTKKQAIAIRMLDATFASTEPLFDESEFVAGPKLKRKIQTWKKSLVDEEIEELDEHMQIIYSWVPSRLADEVSSWTEAADDKELAIGRMLCWLCLLRLTDSSASQDARNRLAFSSFFDKSSAVTMMLNLSLQYAGFRNDRKRKGTQEVSLDEALQNNQPFQVSQLAEVVLFRTVEVLPTMSKRWYEEVCPKQSTKSISDFVTTNVAPKSFRRELDKIKSASVFGDMAVSGSVATRQVTATYAQDDFNLRVVVELPPSFPFRSAEVDCSKTLGIPVKRWRQWGLQIRLMLNSQDGTILDALMLWKENVDKEFAGVEPCPVCYSVLSVKKHELPNTQCKTCQNRFHSTCLKQWFLSSGKSQCVLCQQPWSGVRTQ
jgi:hypothetical protein